MHVLYLFSAPRPECTTDPECLLHLACIQQRCQDPCSTHRCGTNALCKVANHRAYCVCQRGFEGDPQRVCEERKILVGERVSVLLRLTLNLAGCKSDFECRDDQACIRRECQNPCLFEECGTNAYCEARRHRANCICEPNTKGDPHRHCEPYECLADPDCPDHLACRNEKCVDPCDCAANADCTARGHRGICTCRTGYTGDPYVRGCTKSKIRDF